MYISEAVFLFPSCVFLNLLCCRQSGVQRWWMGWGVGEVGSGHGGKPESIGSVMRWPGAR